MFDIIICEDNSYQKKQIETIIINEVKKLNLNINIALSTNNPENVIKLVENCKATFLYFLDIELESKINGIELAKMIRKYDPMGYIVFVTSHAEFTLLTFQYKVQAMDYIIKTSSNNFKNEIIECINEAYDDFINANIIKINQIPINIANRIVNFNLDDILFFETSDKNHKIRLHTCEEQIEFYGTLREIEKMVSPNYYKCHRSYLVNTKRIKSIDKNNLIIHMMNDETCYIAAQYLKGLLKKCLI